MLPPGSHLCFILLFCALALLLQVHRYAWILQGLDTSREDHPPLRRSLIIVSNVMWYLVRLCMALSPHAVEVDFSLGSQQEHERQIDMLKRKAVARRCTPLQPSPYASLCDSA